MNVRKLIVDALRRFPALDSWLLLRRLGLRTKKYSARSFGDGLISEDLYRLLLSRGTAAPKPKVLIATGTGGHKAALEMELVLSAALTARGAEVQALLCDGVLPACQLCEPRIFPDAGKFASNGPGALCKVCYAPGRDRYYDTGLSPLRYSQYLAKEDFDEARELAQSVPISEIENFKVGDVSVGEHAKAGTLRYFARGTLSNDPVTNSVYRRYFNAALLTYFAISKLVKQENIDVAVFHHGIYVPQGVIGATLRARNVRVVNWNVAYRRNCFIFSHDDTYHHTLMTEPPETWEDMSWSLEREKAIDDYLISRRSGTQDWIHFLGEPVFDEVAIYEKLGCDRNKPIILCLSNVVWDAQLHYPKNAFENMFEWVKDTIEYFQGRPDLQLVIRIHPAELRGSVPTRQPLEEQIRAEFPSLPSNVFLVMPDDDISSYKLADLCSSAIIYGTKMGVELTAMSIPVIVGGEAWIRNKGLTRDVKTRKQYRSILSELPSNERLTAEATAKAKKYAYHFFFRRMIPVSCFSQGSDDLPYQFTGGLSGLLPGKDAGLDVICRGILLGTDFIYHPEELSSQAGWPRR